MLDLISEVGPTKNLLSRNSANRCLRMNNPASTNEPRKKKFPFPEDQVEQAYKYRPNKISRQADMLKYSLVSFSLTLETIGYNVNLHVYQSEASDHQRQYCATNSNLRSPGLTLG